MEDRVHKLTKTMDENTMEVQKTFSLIGKNMLRTVQKHVEDATKNLKGDSDGYSYDGHEDQADPGKTYGNTGGKSKNIKK